MERYPHGLPEEVRKQPHLLNQMMRGIEDVGIPKRQVPNRTVTKPRKRTPSRRPRLSR